MKTNKIFCYVIIIIFLYIIITFGPAVIKNFAIDQLYPTESTESFGATSPGTMVQLSSSHVTTEEDVDYYKNVYPKMVRKDILDMTGGDPGPIKYYPYA
jgi:capsule polysaccharide export protein KpsE/RkpR